MNNRESEIIRDLNERFQPLAKNDKLDLYPEKLRKEIDEMNEWTYHAINNGVYKCGFARTQEAYDAAMEELYEVWRRLESILQTSGMKYLLSDDDVTETDVRVYQTLVRFDEVYVVYFKTNKKCIREYKHLSAYVKRLHAMPAFQKATNMWDIKTHYFTSHLALNPYGIIPKGDPSWLINNVCVCVCVCRSCKKENHISRPIAARSFVFVTCSQLSPTGVSFPPARFACFLLACTLVYGREGRRRSSSLSLCVERHPRLWMCVCPHLLASSYVRRRRRPGVCVC